MNTRSTTKAAKDKQLASAAPAEFESAAEKEQHDNYNAAAVEAQEEPHIYEESDDGNAEYYNEKLEGLSKQLKDLHAEMASRQDRRAIIPVRAECNPRMQPVRHQLPITGSSPPPALNASAPYDGVRNRDLRTFRAECLQHFLLHGVEDPQQQFLLLTRYSACRSHKTNVHGHNIESFNWGIATKIYGFHAATARSFWT